MGLASCHTSHRPAKDRRVASTSAGHVRRECCDAADAESGDPSTPAVRSSARPSSDTRSNETVWAREELPLWRIVPHAGEAFRRVRQRPPWSGRAMAERPSDRCLDISDHCSDYVHVDDHGERASHRHGSATRIVVMSSRVAITGATGYLGSVLSDHFSSRGSEVVALTRRRPERADNEWRHFELGRPISAEIFQDVDVLIHAAWVLSGRDTSRLWRENVIGSRRLIEAA